jgi:hypothetical protein
MEDYACQLTAIDREHSDKFIRESTGAYARCFMNPSLAYESSGPLFSWSIACGLVQLSRWAAAETRPSR